MMSRFKVRTLRFPNGERLPILLNNETGMPEFFPNLFATTQLRQINLASKTIERNLRDISVMLDFFWGLKIDIIQEIMKGRVLSLGEISGVAEHCRKSFRYRGQKKNSSVHFLKNYKDSMNTVSAATTAVRLQSIHNFLKWFLNVLISDPKINDEIRRKLRRDQTVMLKSIKARISAGRRRNRLGAKKAVDNNVIQFVYSVVHPESKLNPWKNQIVRERNWLIIQLLFRTGIRRGELLGLKIEDINFLENYLTVKRRPDDPEDNRLHEPNTKTLSRRKTLSPDMLQLLRNYILFVRRKVRGVEKHNFLIVSSKSGGPLSLAGYDDIFRELRNYIVEVPKTLTGHVCRHTFSTELAKKMFKDGRESEYIQQVLCSENGWEPTSSMPELYTRLHIEELAQEASAALQDQLKMRVADGDE